MNALLTVLVAERNEDFARDLTDALAQNGWKTIQARDAVSATAAVLRSRPDAVILNSALPGGGGLLTLRRIRASVHTTMTPVLVIADSAAVDAEEFRSSGADELVHRPVDVLAVAAWVGGRLGEPVEEFEAPPSILRDPERLASLDRTQLLDHPPVDAFDTLTRLASSLLGVPVALVSLVDRDRQFFISHVGLPEPWASQRETPLSHSFCQWVVSDHGALVITDSRQHPVLRTNGALGDLGVVAYAGVPVTGTDGSPLGSFCAIDAKPHEWSEDDLALLRELAGVAEACVALHEYEASAAGDAGEDEGRVVVRTLAMAALGQGISTATETLRRPGRSLQAKDREDLLSLVEWLAQSVVRLAGESN